MSDLKKYIKKRKSNDAEFAKEFDSGYEQFKIGVMLKQAREEAGITQEELAHSLHTKKQQYQELKIMLKTLSFLLLKSLLMLLVKISGWK
jgi:ribosome-binding protein aMBF1 (putative translation factor)